MAQRWSVLARVGVEWKRRGVPWRLRLRWGLCDSAWVRFPYCWLLDAPLHLHKLGNGRPRAIGFLHASNPSHSSAFRYKIPVGTVPHAINDTGFTVPPSHVPMPCPASASPAYRRHERRASMLEVPRLQTMRHLAALAQERAHSATKTRKLERRRQSELRGAFSAAIQERIAAVSAGVYTRSREMVTAELWAMAKGVLLEAWDRLTVVVAELGVTMIEVEEALQKQDLER